MPVRLLQPPASIPLALPGLAKGCLCPLPVSFTSCGSSILFTCHLLSFPDGLSLWTFLISHPSACLCPPSHTHVIFVLFFLCPPLSLSSFYSHSTPALSNSPLHVSPPPPSFLGPLGRVLAWEPRNLESRSLDLEQVCDLEL